MYIYNNLFCTSKSTFHITLHEVYNSHGLILYIGFNIPFFSAVNCERFSEETTDTEFKRNERNGGAPKPFPRNPLDYIHCLRFRPSGAAWNYSLMNILQSL